MYKYISRRMREADNKSGSIFLLVVGVYVVRTSSLKDKQLPTFQKSFQSCSSFFFCLHGQPKLFASDHLLQS